MEDGVKQDPTQCKKPKFLGKAGWVKKAPGKLLASYKDRYIHVEKTEIVVYENEDLQNCLERVDLENYDKCQELKNPFKKRHRLILIRSAKPGNKAHDVKFQVQSSEEKEAWIKALTDGISRAKNKVFDEVKIDESNNLEHVTRSRPKGNRNRRPPTRIHMKEVADVSSDGILRLDLDLEDAVMPNGTHNVNADSTDTPRQETQVPMPPSSVSTTAEKQSGPSTQETETEPDSSPQKKVIKPPMPPTKEAKSSSAPVDEPDKGDSPEKQVLRPMPPSKEAKLLISPVEEVSEETPAENVPEKSPDARKKTGPPPAPPSKPSSRNSMSNLVEDSKSSSDHHPPTPPSKEKKPSHAAEDLDQEDQGALEKYNKKEEDNRKAASTAMETNEEDHSISKEALQSVSTEVQVSEKKPCPPPPSTKKPEKSIHPDVQHGEDKQKASDTSDSSVQAEMLPKSEFTSVVVSSNDPHTDNFSPLICHLPEEKKMNAEEKSVDSGQHSDNDSEGSGSEDLLAVSTTALRGSQTGLNVLEASEDNIEISVEPTKAVTKPQVRSKVFGCLHSKPTTPLNPAVKAKSASISDLLSDSSVNVQVRQHPGVVAGGDRSTTDDVTKLETEVALEIKKTGELLSKVSQSQGGGDGEGMPEDLLNKAIEKLKTADNVLREVKKLKLAKNLRDRKSL